jgi:hypothetical protein
MNMEFSKTSGSRPELDRGVRIILRYDGETAKGKAKQMPFDISGPPPPEALFSCRPHKMKFLEYLVCFYVIDCT